MGILSGKKEEKGKKERLQLLKDKRDLAVKWRDVCGFDTRMNRAWNYYYYGVPDDINDANKEKVNKRRANYVFSNIESIIPKMFDRFPGFQVKGNGQDDLAKAPKVEAILKYKVENVLGLDEKLEDSSRDMLVSALGLLKLTWGYDEKVVKEGDEENKQILKDDLELSVVNPKNFYITAGDTRLKTCEGVFEKMILGIDEAKNKYGNKYNFEANHFVVTVTEDDKERLKAAGAKTVVWEYHGVIDGKKTVITFTDNDILQERDWYEHNHLPYIELPNYRGAHEYYPWSEVYQIEPLQDELIEIDEQQSEFRKRAINPKKIVIKGAVDSLNMQRLRNPRINVIEATQPNAVNWEQPALIGQDIYRMREQKKEDISLTTGMNEQSRGGVEKTVNTATGQQILLDATQGRIRQKVRALERAIKEILFQARGLLAQFQDREEIIKITDDPVNPFQGYTKEDIQGNFDYVIDMVESMPLLREKRGQLALQAYQLFKDDKEIDQTALKKRVAKLAFQDINAEDLIIEAPPEPPPQPVMPQPEMMPPEMAAVPQEQPESMPFENPM